MNKQTCKITNGQFTWVMEVDNQVINFDLSENAEYFYKHYRELGYKMIIDDEHNWIKCLEEERV